MKCEKCGFEVFGGNWKRYADGKAICLECFNKEQKKLDEIKQQ